eukprot:TRINITY_DN11973_c0_g3_i1.p1 TRINITY_DN11973_c0_g3~~TRINITY_DN11973_c0_g3_i1.p1  ORF type:complete len:147 (-),score=18.50 TRINITY_DN11973_c0_g3_i1:100-540(-)
MQQIWPDTFARISSAHCRGDIPVWMGPGWLYQWFGVQSGSSVVSRTGRFAWLRGLNAHLASAWYKQQLLNRPDLLCINDDFERHDVHKFEHQMAELRTFMDELSGGKTSQFEIGANGDVVVHLNHVVSDICEGNGRCVVRLDDDAL